MTGNLEALTKSIQRRRLADGLVIALCGTFTLGVKTQCYGWNVSGPFASSLRVMFNGMHDDMFGAVEEMAVRLRVLGCPAPSAFSQFSVLSGIHEEAECPGWREMIEQLVLDQDIVIEACRKVHDTAELSADTATLGLMARRVTRHERYAWELRILLE
ncbi:MAG TPA: ferritin-like domain-containing protein [Arenimonas sp.]|nr:ferritin-like domain-containing protein [Arenimonas sp.]